MAINYTQLYKQYDGFRHPVIEIEVDGNRLSDATKTRIAISDITIDISAGFEASQAVFCLYNVYDPLNTAFDFKSARKFILLGSAVKIYLGYNSIATTVFAGVITKVDFFYEENEYPGIRVTAMDVKAVMMANNSSKQFKANTYSEAVKEIFDQSIYQTLRGDGAISELTILSTPDGGAADAATSAVGSLIPGAGSLTGGASQAGEAATQQAAAKMTDKSIESVGESDYEFVVKVAKKYNMDFFVSAGQVVFRSAKSDTNTLMEITNEMPIKALNVEYDLTSQVGVVEVRGLDAGKAKVLTGKQKNSNKLSQGSKAKSLISGTSYVYLDPSASSTEEAQYRAKYIQEDRTYRLITLDLTIVGLPELLPGRFIDLKGFGTGVDNTYYIHSIKHTMDSDGLFLSRITGKAASAASGLDIGGAAGAITDKIPSF